MKTIETLKDEVSVALTERGYVREKIKEWLEYVGLLAYDGSVHHANTAHWVCSVRSTAFVCISGQLQTFEGELYHIK